MPHKFNAERRDKIPKQRHRVTNWAEYNEGLRRRGDLTVWISEDALALWSAPRRTTRGGQPHYSDLAIELCLTLGLVFKQPLRQTQGLMRSIARLLGVGIAVPDFSILSRRGNGLTLRLKPRSKSDKPLQLVVDSTGLKIFGEGDWLEQKHKTKRKRRSWRKLHLGLDLVSGQIVCSDLTQDDVGDPTALPDLLDQVDGPVDLFLADGAYDGERTSDLLAARFGSAIEVTIPPPRNAILSPNAAKDPTARDRHIAEIAARGRMVWQKATGYNQRSRGETLMGRWKTVIGPKLKARTFENQKTEAKIGVRVLNRMTGLGSPSFKRTA
ncbi:Transposase DDE domain-containing protein [Sulfitobacter brevis]|uniref:Transposase DDE domain-containing protein n=1 Tax=Sulfitobacter brevis TaxID=74348 RepID=A0A1I2HF78_9RHOB|nr:IS5 family transposase [Sulfitobacter brevis]SFF27960.1 Transposase DDE domain-containing protein [Sulfitobacter brevis]